MAANNDKPSAADKKREEAERKQQAEAEAEAQAQVDAQASNPPTPPTGDRAARESASTDTVPVREALVGSDADAPVDSNLPASDTLVAAAESMIERSQQEQAGVPFTPPPLKPDEHDDAIDIRPRVSSRLRGDPLGRLAAALAEHEASEPLTVDELHPLAPGQTERGWSPEVTARHPMLLAETIAELIEDEGGSAPSLRVFGGRGNDGFVDPTDRQALENALNEIGFTEVRKTMLINRAIRINYERLARTESHIARTGPASVLAGQQALDEMQGQARSAGHQID